MALALINASAGQTDVTIDGDSYQDVLAYIDADDNRTMLDATVFSTGSWIDELPSRRQLVCDIAGFASQGDAISNPSTLMDDLDGVPVVITWATGCTKTFTGIIGRSRITQAAAALGGWALSIRSKGAVITAWVVA